MTVAAPTTAERIRSACVRGGGAMLAVEGLEPAATPVHHLLDDGSFAITVPATDCWRAWSSPRAPRGFRPCSR